MDLYGAASDGDRPIRTAHYRYKRPLRRKKPAAFTVPEIITTHEV
jgi:hypothetical protein